MGLELLKDRLHEIRSQNNLTQKEMASKLGVKPATYSAYESGKNNPSIYVLMKIVELFDVSLDWLCGLTENKTISGKESIETYSDVIKILCEINDKINIEIFTSENLDEESGRSPSLHYGITFRDDTLDGILKDWANMLHLLNSDTITKNLYTLWIYDMINKYDYEIEF